MAKREKETSPNTTGVQASKQKRLTHEPDNTPLFPPKFTEFAKQLREMLHWFLDYRERVDETDDNAIKAIIDIENALGEVVYSIGELVSNEFKDNAYYKL